MNETMYLSSWPTHIPQLMFPHKGEQSDAFAMHYYVNQCYTRSWPAANIRLLVTAKLSIVQHEREREQECVQV